MLPRWTRIGAQLFAVYLVLHLIVTVVDNVHVMEHTKPSKKKLSDGPLIVKDRSENVIDRVEEDIVAYVLFARYRIRFIIFQISML